MNLEKKSKLRERIEAVLKHKATNLENAYTKNLEELIEDLKIYQYELEFQNDELQRIHLELEDSRNEYRMLFHYAPVGYVILNDDFEVLDCNETFKMMIKKKDECKKKMDFRKLIDPAFQDVFHHFCNGLLNNGADSQLEIKLNVSDDSDLYTNIVGNYSKSKNSGRIFLSINNITEKKLAEAHLKQSEERFRNIFNNNHAVMLLTDPVTGDIKAANLAAEHYYGWKKQEMTRMNISQINIMSSEEIALEMQAAKAANKKYFDFRHILANGDTRDVEVYSGPVVIENKEMLYSIVHDVTNRRIIENNLIKTKELLLQTSRMARVGGWEIDLASEKAKWSEVTREIAEVEPDYEPDLTDSIGFYKEGTSRQNIQRLLNEAIEKGTPFDEELQIVTAKGNLKWVRALGKPEFNDGKCIRIYGTFQDIDENKKQQEILQKSEKELKELNATKDKLFSIIAHDLKSPFNSILGLSELLKEDASDCEPQNILKYSKMINASATQAYNLLENLLDWARMQLGSIKINKETLNLKEEVDSVKYFLSSQMESKNIALINKVPVELKLFADVNTVKTVLRNLISNAVKFSRNGGKIIINASLKDDHAQITISDNGIGIKKKDIGKLFRQGEYFTTPGTENENGTGLGLMLCKEFIENQNGRIWVESEEGNGSTFYFTIQAWK